LLQPPKGAVLAVATDTLVEGVHFMKGLPPSPLGWKALAVNLSDLAAMGAEPAFALLNLTLPDGRASVVDEFMRGFEALAQSHRVALVGGDTTQGPLAVTVTVIGYVPKGEALRREGARIGDDLWVTGTLGDAAGALALWRGGTPMLRTGGLRERMDRPIPRVGAGRVLRGIAHCCIDVSDGLLADLGHLLDAAGLGADLDAGALPASSALVGAFPAREQRLPLQLTGGDDYELLFTAHPRQRAEIERALAAVATPVTRIGSIVPGSVVRLLDDGGNELPVPPRAGWEHFRGTSA
jgi:thiamine-monophosphate kinase